MAQVHGKAGAAPYRKGDRLMFRALTSMLILGVLTYLLFRRGIPTVGFAGAGTICVIVALGFWCVRHVFSLEAAADQYYGGAGGEYVVGVVLSRLPQEFHVFNGLGFYAGDIDHIIIGPTGIFIVETKNHSGTISVRDGCLCRNGDRLTRDFVRQVSSEAMYVKAWLKPQVPCHVRALVVFSRAKVRVRRSIGGVRVVALASLTDTITDRAPSLSTEEIRRYVERLNSAIALQSTRARRRTPAGGSEMMSPRVTHPGFIATKSTRRMI